MTMLLRIIGGTALLVAIVGARIFTSAQGENWVPQVQTFDGVEMVLVPSGCFMMGSSDAEIATLTEQRPNLAYAFRDAGPQTRMCFDEPFWIDKYLVTNAQFRQFHGVAGRDSYWTDDNRPREMISWFEARDFCGLREARLPSEAEWEYAARGPNSLAFPWGDTWNPDNAVWSI
ncbi:MAG: formylglycine-generating enzyme family protein, partial [Burkholderiales bacterium]|nr:formylglycine-generating enzyme family protein [Anaerolineae bacterium]